MKNQKPYDRTRLFSSPFSKDFWISAAREFTSVRSLCVCALIVALRVALKSISIEVAPSLSITFGFFANALGSMIYGPLAALVGGAVSDTLGALIFPSGPYFFPFIFVEMLGSFLFALFLYRQKVSVLRVFLSRFAVSFLCNIICTSALMIPYYQIFYNKDYTFLTLPRVIKNIMLFPAESVLLVLFLNALLPALSSLGFLPKTQRMKFTKKNVFLLVVLTLVCLLLSAVLYILYIYLKDKVASSFGSYFFSQLRAFVDFIKSAVASALN
ncbi:MAG: folate family ECF transporter S component [Clostridia bacterium]|nr:folate family ECF transporter S component [Clostridia bacterium]